MKIIKMMAFSPLFCPTDLHKVCSTVSMFNVLAAGSMHLGHEGQHMSKCELPELMSTFRLQSIFYESQSTVSLARRMFYQRICAA